jgi:hypothetical protein
VVLVFVLMPGAKHWCLTLNNYSQDDEELWQAVGTEGGDVSYLIFGKEVGENGTPHFQGYVSFKTRRRLSYVKDLFGDRLHAEPAKGSPTQNREYCSKGGDYQEFGTLPKGRGSRTDLAAALACVKAGGRKRQLLEEHTQAYARAHRVLGEAMLVYATPRNWVPVVRVYWGETGVGKTKRAFEESEETPYMHSGGMWFDGYDGESNVIFDDFGGSEFKLTYLLKLLDRYPMRVQIKGGFVNWAPRNIWITSNYSPKEWFPNAKDEHCKALFRRFTQVIRFRRMASVLAVDNDGIETECVVE